MNATLIQLLDPRIVFNELKAATNRKERLIAANNHVYGILAAFTIVTMPTVLSKSLLYILWYPVFYCLARYIDSNPLKNYVGPGAAIFLIIAPSAIPDFFLTSPLLAMGVVLMLARFFSVKIESKLSKIAEEQNETP